MLKINFFSEKHILERIQANDRQVLGELYVKYERMVFSYVLRQNGSRDEAEDLLQEAIIVLWQKVNNGTFNLTSKLSTFIMAVVKNKFLAERRKLHYTERDDLPEHYTDSESDGLDILLEAEQQDLISRALQEISALCRELLNLFYFEERSLEDIARQLDLANSNVVKSKKYQCKKALQEKITLVLSEAGRV